MARSVSVSPQHIPIPTGRPQPLLRPGPDDWALCRQVTREHGRTFYFACKLLPPPERRGVHAIYAWCRRADDIADTASTSGIDRAHAALDQWLDAIEAPIDPISRAFAWVVREYGIPVEPARDLIAGVRMDLGPLHFRTWEDLRWYSYCVAGTVGLMTAPLLGCTDESALPHALNLGIAMQLTNILRDVAEDAAMGRVYLPDEDLARFGVSRESLLCLRPTGDFRGLMQFEIERARALYRDAHAGIGFLSRSGQITTIAGSHLYREILCRIEEQDYDVFRGRATVSTPQKVFEMPTVMGTFLRLQWMGFGDRFRL